MAGPQQTKSNDQMTSYIKTWKELQERDTSKAGDPTNGSTILRALTSRRKALVFDLVKELDINVADFGSTLKTLENSKAIVLSGSGLDQVVEITPLGQELASLI
ncbi:MAG TPA: hypothetical protein VK934_00040 [Fimbriimonas sp.]|nr:hypothetical protein [Fimbriimonas sp.]